MDDVQKQTLLKVAKDTVEAVIKGEPTGEPQSDDPELNSPCGCFVTLKDHGRLRGCIGQFTSQSPLIKLIAEMAMTSAKDDPRFLGDPIAVDELEQLDIEISVLSLLERTDDPLSLRLGVDGIYIIQGGAHGCYLPQVTAETGWSKEEFLSSCCSHKAGLAPDAWKDPETEVFLFTADVFGAAWKDI